MDAVKYLKDRGRMCDSYNNMCDGCGFGKVPKCNRTEEDNPEKAVEIVEKWSAEHPIKTRQSEFLKIYPDARIAKNGAIQICPNRIEKSKEFDCHVNCHDCQKEYWLAEVE